MAGQFVMHSEVEAPLSCERCKVVSMVFVPCLDVPDL